MVGSLLVAPHGGALMGQQRLALDWPWVRSPLVPLVMLALGLAGRFDVPLSLLGPMLVVVAGGGIVVPIGFWACDAGFSLAAAWPASRPHRFLPAGGYRRPLEWPLSVWLPDTSQGAAWRSPCSPLP